MKKLWMWAVGVPFLVVGMVVVTFTHDDDVAVARQGTTRAT